MPVNVVEVVGALGEVFVAVVVLPDRSLELVLTKLVPLPIHVFGGHPIKFGELCKYPLLFCNNHSNLSICLLFTLKYLCSLIL